jgi:hypothetical protein
MKPTHATYDERRRSWRSDPQLVTATRARVAEWPPIASADLTAHARLQLILNLVSPLAHERLWPHGVNTHQSPLLPFGAGPIMPTVDRANLRRVWICKAWSGWPITARAQFV